jgi:endonuclease/exonuclease/phosphatase family metal-dependent hydrolase
VITWNLFHGRDFPPNPGLRTWRSRLLRVTERDSTHAQVNRPLLEEFAAVLNRLEWDIALLQEAPPRWQRALAERSGASSAIAITSRNFLPRLRAALAEWNPDLIASNEGGSNQVLVRPPSRIEEVRRDTLALRPERRRMLWTRLELDTGTRLAAATLHATAGDPPVAAKEVERAAVKALEWAGEDPLVLGGDMNVQPGQAPEMFERMREHLGIAAPTAPKALDHLFARGVELVEAPRRLAPEEREIGQSQGLRIRLSDHAPVTATFRVK